MKRIPLYPVVCFLSVLLTSCEIDNFEAPGSTIKGVITDAATGKPLQLEQGLTGTRIYTAELSWSDNPTPYYLAVKQDGTYVNTKMADGQYRIYPVEGPFIPLVIPEEHVDNSKIIQVKGEGIADFSVEPFLRVEYVGDPVIEADNRITVKFRFTKGQSTSYFEIPPFEDCQLFISPNRYVGNNNYDSKLVNSVLKSYNGKSKDQLVGETISITTKVPLGSTQGPRTYYIRIGARVSDSFKSYNYTYIREITVPKL